MRKIICICYTLFTSRHPTVLTTRGMAQFYPLSGSLAPLHSFYDIVKMHRAPGHHVRLPSVALEVSICMKFMSVFPKSKQIPQMKIFFTICQIRGTHISYLPASGPRQSRILDITLHYRVLFFVSPSQRRRRINLTQDYSLQSGSETGGKCQ